MLLYFGPIYKLLGSYSRRYHKVINFILDRLPFIIYKYILAIIKVYKDSNREAQNLRVAVI